MRRGTFAAWSCYWRQRLEVNTKAFLKVLHIQSLATSSCHMDAVIDANHTELINKELWKCEHWLHSILLLGASPRQRSRCRSWAKGERSKQIRQQLCSTSWVGCRPLKLKLSQSLGVFHSQWFDGLGCPKQDARNLPNLEKASSLTLLLEVAREDIKGNNTHGVSTHSHESLTFQSSSCTTSCVPFPNDHLYHSSFTLWPLPYLSSDELTQQCNHDSQTAKIIERHSCLWNNKVQRPRI